MILRSTNAQAQAHAKGGSAGKCGRAEQLILIVVLYVMEGACLGLYSSSRSLFLVAVTESLNISRSVYGLNDSIRFLMSAFMSFFFGMFVSRFGRKTMMLVGFISMIGCMLLYSVAESIVVFYIGSILLGFGMCWTTTSMTGSIAHQCFRNQSGRIVGFIMTAGSLFSAVSVQILSPIIYDETNPFGYRKAFRLMALTIAITGVIVMALYRDKGTPAPDALKRSPQKSRCTIVQSGVIRNSYFHIVCGCVFMTGFALQGVFGTYAAHLRDVGLDAGTIVNLASLISLSLMVCKFLIGVLHDHSGLSFTTTISYVAGGIGMFILTTFKGAGSAMLWVFGALYAVALPLETIIPPLVAADLVGSGDYNRMTGILVAVISFGYAAGSTVTNLTFNLFGSYRPMYLFLGVAMIAIMLTFNLVIRAVAKDCGATGK
jgi:MFS family permease